MQTAVDYLQDEILQDRMIKAKSIKEWNDVINKAREMEKQQIIDAHGNKVKKSSGVTNYLYTLTGEKYYNETYGSKGSDEHIVDTNEMISSPTEISDKEIKEIVEQEYKRYPNNDYLYGHSEELQLAYKAGIWDGIKWYREQLKKKQ